MKVCSVHAHVRIACYFGGFNDVPCSLRVLPVAIACGKTKKRVNSLGRISFDKEVAVKPAMIRVLVGNTCTTEEQPVSRDPKTSEVRLELFLAPKMGREKNGSP